MDSFMFNVFPAIFTIMFVGILGVVILTIIKGISEWHSNNQQPILTVEAKIVSKRQHRSRHHHNHNDHAHHSTSTSYYVTFEVESHDRMELRVSGKEYGLLAEGDTGKLTFQGTRYHEFNRKYSG